MANLFLAGRPLVNQAVRVPKPIVYSPNRFRVAKPPPDVNYCNIPGACEVVTTTSSTIYNVARAATTTPRAVTTTSDAAYCATTDAACMNCALAYSTMYAWQDAYPNFFSWNYTWGAEALCYVPSDESVTSLIWAPLFFDAPWSWCPDYWSSRGYSSAYKAAVSNMGYCTDAGNFMGAYYTYIDGPTFPASAAAQITALATSGLQTTASGASPTSPAATAIATVSASSTSTTSASSMANTNSISAMFCLLFVLLSMLFRL